MTNKTTDALTVGAKVRANAAYLTRYPSANGPSRLTGRVGIILRDMYGDGSRFEIDFGIPAPVSKTKTVPTWILGPQDLEAANG